jgi:hypothetical protein
VFSPLFTVVLCQLYAEMFSHLLSEKFSLLFPLVLSQPLSDILSPPCEPVTLYLLGALATFLLSFEISGVLTHKRCEVFSDLFSEERLLLLVPVSLADVIHLRQNWILQFYNHMS